MTPQQIEKKIEEIIETLEPKESWKDNLDEKAKIQAKAELTSLITTLQKETWDQACKAMMEQVNDEIGSYQLDEGERVEGLLISIKYPPFNPEK